MTRTSISPELAEMYIASGRVRTQISKENVRQHLRRFQSQYPSLVVEKVTSAHLTEYCLSGGVADNTIRTRRSTIGPVFDWAAFNGLIPASPAAVLKFTVTPGRNPKRLGNWLSENEIGLVMRSCDLDDFVGRRERVVVAVGFYMGLRLAAIAGLRWGQFSPDLTRWEGVVKGGKPVRKGIPPQLREILLEWRREAPLGAVAVIPRTKRASFKDATLAPDWSEPLGADRLYAVVRNVGQRCGIKGFAPHDMRRSLAGVLQKKGVPLDQIKDVLDHSNIGTTNTYLNKNPNIKIEATEAIHFDF